MISAAKNLILQADDRKKRQSEKQKAVLHFLRQHLWSSQDILRQVMNLKSRQAAHKTLSQMQTDGLVRSHQFLALGGKLTLWGITAHGQVMSFDTKTEVPYSSYFEPSRIAEQNIRHQLDIQKLRLSAEEAGWHGWVDGDRLGVLEKNDKRPDAVAKHPIGLVVAIECERTFKTVKRYEQILVSYLKLLKAGKVTKVVWVLPTQDMADRLHLLITNIKSVKVAGHKVQINPEKHHVNIHFCAYENWPISL